MSGHTPGPWVLTAAGEYVYSETHDTSFFWLDVGDAHPRLGRSDPHAKANARLIAAAPDLLKACECALSTGVLQHGGVDEILRAAIAKATGAPND